MTLEDFLKASGNGYQYICVLIARFVDKDGFTSDFTYKGCAMSNDWLLENLKDDKTNPADAAGYFKWSNNRCHAYRWTDFICPAWTGDYR